jgi:hypothetical protein
MATTSSTTDLEASIQDEEALIRAYEAELSFLQQNNDLQPDTENDSEQNDDDDGLEDLFRHPTPRMNLVAGEDSEKTECLELTQSVQDFVFTSVEDKTTNTPEAHAFHATRFDYELKGYFVSNSTISACIRMTTERPQHTSTKSSRKRKRDISSRVVSLAYQLESSDGEDLAVVENLASQHAHKNSLADWTQRVSAYLKFEKMQRGILDRWQNTFPDFQWSKDEDKLKVELIVGGAGKQKALPTFSWGWEWKEEKDFLEMRERNEFHLSGKGLQDLVAVTGSCQGAMAMILKTIQPVMK